MPEHGYPAELGVNVGSGQPVFLYADVVHGKDGYRLRIATPGALRVFGQEPIEIRVNIFGDPGAMNGSGSDAAFVTNPANCPAKPLAVSAYVNTWEGEETSAETTAYPELTGCNLLLEAGAFDPSFVLEPETTQADTPSGYAANLRLPQAPSVFGALATPDLRKASITFPAGVSISPAAASGPDALAGCAATGTDGINIGSSDVAPDGEDLGDPQATELGEGHAGGDGSPYDDGLWHTAPGHCPGNSRVGEVEVRTPVLSEPLRGHLYIAQPGCGQAGRAPCTEAEAEQGEVFGAYLEVAGSGVIVKLHCTIEVGGSGAQSSVSGLAPGQVRVRFDEDPQFPVEDVKVTLPGGPRATLANPQTCGTATTSTELEPSSATTPGLDATPSSSFAVTGCAGATPFDPGFQAGTVTPVAGGFSPFVLNLARQDGEQNLSGLQVTLPEGLLAKIAGVAECGDAEANAGTCPSASEIGTVTVTAGAGSQPLVESGKVYLTGPYNGGAFGEVAVVNAVAGPFNFGRVVVRGSIRIDPSTAQTTIVSDPFPTLVGGIPIRLRSVDVAVNRPGFTFNPTDCNSQAVTGTVRAAQGASTAVSSPFAVAGCAGMPFKPVFTVSTSSATSRMNGASLHVNLSYPAGAMGTQANIKSVKVELPRALPSRLTTLQKACTAEQFETNPSGCPTASVIGHAIVHTPLLPVALEGPVYFVSHGGEAFPNLVMVLEGDNVTIELVGDTHITDGITSTTFKSTPDVPFETFELTLPQGQYSVLAAYGNLCQEKLVMPTAFVGQNGATLNQNTRIEVEGCANTLTPISKTVKAKTITLKIAVPSAGKLSASGNGLTSTTATAGGRETVTVRLRQKQGGKPKAKIKLRFQPTNGQSQSKSLTVRLRK